MKWIGFGCLLDRSACGSWRSCMSNGQHVSDLMPTALTTGFQMLLVANYKFAPPVPRTWVKVLGALTYLTCFVAGTKR